MNVYDLVTERILEELKYGVVPWHKPWISLNKGAYNYVTGHRYSTLNQLLLIHDGPYASMKQWNKLGGKIKKGSKSEIVTFWKAPEEEESESSEEEKKTLRPVLRYYRVFHISQVDGVEWKEPEKEENPFTLVPEAETAFRNYLMMENIQLVQEESDHAYYSPERDLIHLPLSSQFRDDGEYYSTVFHEACHSTGHSKRLNREGIQNVSYGSEEYSKEELIAEIGASCLLSTMGLETLKSFVNNASYVFGWLNAIRGDHRLVVSAASKAEQAARYILACSGFQTT